MKPVQEVFGMAASATGLEALGFKIDFNVKRLDNIECEADAKDEEEWANDIMSLAMSMAKHRVMSCSH